jgi:hypothetical protein
VRHAGAVDFGEDVTRQVGLEVQVLDHLQRIVEGLAAHVLAEDFFRAVALQLAAELVREQRGAHLVGADRHAVEVRRDRVARQRLEGGLAA